ncbi:MAG: hypothetical protein AMXMBFR53_17680 [Gemmatimonadota bacterium]
MRILSRTLAGAALAALLAAVGTPVRAAAQSANDPGAANPTTAGRSPGGPLRFFGPLTTEEAAPLQRVSYTHTVEGADLVPAGRVQTELWVGYANIFERDSAATHDLLLDLERLSTTAGVRVGVHERLELGGRLSFETTGGGILDDFISGWHSSLGLKNGDRDKVPSGAYTQRLRDARGDVRLDVPQRTMALEDVRLSAKWRAWQSRGGDKVLSLRGVTRFPTQENRVGPQRTDFALMALVRTADAPWYFHGTVGGATVRAAEDFDGLLRGGAFFMDLAVERNLASWVSGVVQLSVASPRLQGFRDPELDGWPVNLVFGATGEVGDGWRVDVSFQEDIPANTPAVDFTLGVGIRRAW